mgnify:CR=1 FL=1
MIASTIALLIIAVAGCFGAMKMYDLFQSKIARILIVQAYGLFVGVAFIAWLIEIIL